MMEEVLIQGAIAILFVLFATAFYTYLLYPACISPMSRIPSAHPFCMVTSLWIKWARLCDREIQVVHDAHGKLGPIVRLGPKEVSVNCMEGGIRTVHGGGFEKPEWYSFFAKYGYRMYLTNGRCQYLLIKVIECSTPSHRWTQIPMQCADDGFQGFIRSLGCNLPCTWHP